MLTTLFSFSSRSLTIDLTIPLTSILPAVIEKATINAGSIDVNGIVKSMVKDREEKENNVVSIDDRKEE